MLLEHRTVSRKTPLDGKLEITERAAVRLRASGAEIPVTVLGQHGNAVLSAFECACRGPEQRHMHYFLESPLLKDLISDTEIRLDWDEGDRSVAVSPA